MLDNPDDKLPSNTESKPISPRTTPRRSFKLSAAKWLEDHPDPESPLPTAYEMAPRSTRGSSRQPNHAQDPATSASMHRRGSRNSQGSNAAETVGLRSTRSHPAMGEDAETYSPGVEGEANGHHENGNGAVYDEEPARNGSGVRSLKLRPPVAPDGDDEDAVGEEEYQDDGHPQDEGEDDYEEEAVVPTKKSGRAKKVISDDEEDEEEYATVPEVVQTVSLYGRSVTRRVLKESSGSEDEKPKRGALRRGGSSKKDEFVEPDEEYDQEEDHDYGNNGRRASNRNKERQTKLAESRRQQQAEARRSRSRGSLTRRSEPKARATRNSSKADISYEHDEDAMGDESTTEEDSHLGLDDEDDDLPATGRKLRAKPKVDYWSIPALEAPLEKKNKGKGRMNDDPFSGLPHNLTGAQWAALYPDKNMGNDDSSDDDGPDLSTPRKAALFSNSAAAAGGFANPGASMFAGGANVDLAGTPNNMGKVGSVAALADTDPLGVSSEVSFDSVGGLGQHIQQLKEMVSLPLLYPEVFERFSITPPRGVLFHGPPGTGKTLLARALAASCSTEGRKISFFMRKGADCLSKWVGEAERQLRLLFEEAKNCQPSIIFFDEIDGLAPVRSSKQEQIHASIVSTLLALMDGMDGRGQVIVIGATNRPDAIDPALRRPGRFDREFYFPLPNLEGRRKILDIHTNGWNPPIEESFKDELAGLTKGYGGADLRALCTEAALNAVQRKYPQIYKTNDRLVIKPESIDVTARDFIISQKNLIPSTARATSSSASPIPPQLVPLLGPALEAAKVALSKVLPEVKRANILEEAEWEDDGGGFEKEKMIQAFETLRVFRPRMLICGEPGMGQGYVGAAVLHHLEGFHVQPLDLATLVSDSSRTMEAACVQLFVEAKRHKPSILFIPSLITWCASVTDTVRATIKGLLDGLDPSDPILLLAVVDGPLSEVPGDVRSWFGFVKGNRVVMTKPDLSQRTAFFTDVIEGIERRPSDFPDAMPRRKRVLEKLEIAPPPPPRVPTAAELQLQLQNDQRQLEYLKWKLGPILNEVKKRYKRFTRAYYDDWRADDLQWREDQLKKGEEIVGLGKQPYHNVDLDSIHMDLYNGAYYTPDDFVEDVLRIQANAEINAHLESDIEGPVKAGQMVNHVKVMIDQSIEPQFKADCAKMAERMKEREKGLPPKVKAKGKGRVVTLDAATVAALALAGGGGHYGTRARLGPKGSNTGAPEIQDIGEIERMLKRSRKELQREDSQMHDDSQEDAHGPSKRSRMDENGTSVNGDDPEEVDLTNDGEEGDAAMDDVEPEQPVASTSNLGAIMNGFTPHEAHPEVLGLPVAPPMAVGASPDPPIVPVTGSAPLSLASILEPVPAAVPSAPAAPHAGPSSVRFAEEVEIASTVIDSNNNTTRETTPIGQSSTSLFINNHNPRGFAASSPTPASPMAVEIEVEEEVVGTPEPPPEFVVPTLALSNFTHFVAESTDKLTIDQLEQLRAACYDVIWRGRKDWDRENMLEELTELAKDFVEEAEECLASSPI